MTPAKTAPVKKAPPVKAAAAVKKPAVKKSAPTKAATGKKVAAAAAAPPAAAATPLAGSRVSGETAVASGTALRSVAPASLVENPLNPRRDVVGVGLAAQEKFDELVDSVRVVGVLEPVLAFERDNVDGTLGRELVLLAGHRRRAAAMRAGCAAVDVVVRAEPSESDQLLMMLIENGHRNDLLPGEEAQAYATLRAQGVPQKEIAIRCGRSEGHVSKRLSIVEKLPAPVVDRLDLPVNEGRLSVEVAYQLTRVEDRKLVEKWTKTPSLNESWLLNDIEQELKSQAAREAERKAAAKLEADGVRVVDRAKALNGVCTVLVGNGKIVWAEYHAKVTWLAMTIDDHKAESCHAATVTSAGKTVWVCDDPSAHKKLKRRKYSGYYGESEYPKTVDDVIGEKPAAGSASSGGPAHPGTPTKKVDDKIVDDKIAVAYEAARVRGVQRLDALHAFLVTAERDALVDVVALYAAAQFSTDLGNLYAEPSIAEHVLGFADYAGGARAKAYEAAFAKQRLQLAAAGAMSAFEWFLFHTSDNKAATVPDYTLSSFYRDGQWFDTMPFVVAKAYVDWLELAGVKAGPLEKAWLAACKEADQ